MCCGGRDHWELISTAPSWTVAAVSKPLLLQAVPTYCTGLSSAPAAPTQNTCNMIRHTYPISPLPGRSRLLCCLLAWVGATARRDSWNKASGGRGPGAGGRPRRCHSHHEMMTVTLRGVWPFSNCSVPRNAGTWCGIWRIINAYNKLALSKPRICCAAGMCTSVHLQPSLTIHYLRTASYLKWAGVEMPGIVQVSGAPAYRSPFSATSPRHPGSPGTPGLKETRPGVPVMAVCWIGRSHSDLAHGNCVSGQPRAFDS